MLHVLEAGAFLYAEKPDDALAGLDEADRIRTLPLSLSGDRHLCRKKHIRMQEIFFYRAEEWCNTYEDSMLTQVWFCKVNLQKRAEVSLRRLMRQKCMTTGMDSNGQKVILKNFLNAQTTSGAGLMYDSLRYYNEAINADPVNAASVLFLKGVVFEQIKRPENALDCYSEALKNNPEPGDEFRIRTRWAALRANRIEK